jgi:hypothetical protein
MNKRKLMNYMERFGPTVALTSLWEEDADASTASKFH